MNALQIAATGMLAQQFRTEVVSNNLANMNTTGFQRSKAEFNDLIYTSFQRPNSVSSKSSGSVPGGINAGLGVKMASIYRVHEQGGLRATGNSLDIAIQGEGFFQIQLPQGDTAYTRDGTFQLDGTGNLVTHDGFVVNPGINIPQEAVNVTINATGEVLVSVQGEEEAANVGVIQLATFANPSGLVAQGDNLYLASTESGDAVVTNPGAAGVGSVQQGFVESSNVNAIEEISTLIKAQRAYDMNAKMITTVDQMLAS